MIQQEQQLPRGQHGNERKAIWSEGLNKWIPYIQINGSWVPDAELKKRETLQAIEGLKYAKTKLEYIIHHNPSLYADLQSKGRLVEYLIQFNEDAKTYWQQCVDQILKDHGVDERMKREDPIKVQIFLNSAIPEADSMVAHSMIYTNEI